MKKLLAVAVATAISAPAMADLTISGSAEYNLSDAGAGTVQSVETNIKFAASTTADNGITVAAGANLEMTSTDGAASASPDAEGINMSIGNGTATVTVGAFGSSNAWLNGADSWAPDAANVAGYDAKSLDDEGDMDVKLSIAAAEGLTIEVAGNLSETSGNNQRGTVTYVMGDVTLAGTIQSSDTAADDGYALSAATTLSDVAVSFSTAANDADSKSIAVAATYDAFSVAYRRNENAAGTDESIYYGEYKLGDMGVPGLSVDVGAGSGADVDTKVGVEVIYAF